MLLTSTVYTFRIFHIQSRKYPESYRRFARCTRFIRFNIVHSVPVFYAVYAKEFRDFNN